nr:hypothetical protein [Gemmatimonadales bacterium]
RQADALKGDADPKLVAFVPVLRSLLQSNFNPIVFCRFIATAEYLAEGLRARLGAQVEIEAVTGTLPPADREARIAALGAKPKRVLVATDCLSEGINLQQHFDAVLHYDLSWNPTRHEQREGRVDRFGQRSREVRVVTFFGANNEVDGWVLEVLLRKHESIRKTLGISVPVPVDSQQVLAAIMEGVLRRRPHGGERQLDIFKDVLREQSGELEREWQRAADREKRSRTLFAQETIKTEEVAAELAAVREALGDGGDLREFVRAAVAAHGGRAAAKNGELVLDLAEAPRALREVFESRDHLALRFQLPVGEDEVHVTRTHPLVERLASFVVSGALDPELGGVARRSGAIRTRAVGKRTTLLLARFRFDLAAGRGAEAAAILAEECALLGFRGAPETAEWLEPGEARALLDARPDANIPADQAAAFVAKVVESLGQLAPRLEAAASERAQALLDAHTRVRRSARVPSTAVRVKPHLPPDVLGVYVLLPVTTVGAAAGGPNPGIRVPR